MATRVSQTDALLQHKQLQLSGAVANRKRKLKELYNTVKSVAAACALKDAATGLHSFTFQFSLEDESTWLDKQDIEQKRCYNDDSLPKNESFIYPATNFSSQQQDDSHLSNSTIDDLKSPAKTSPRLQTARIPTPKPELYQVSRHGSTSGRKAGDSHGQINIFEDEDQTIRPAANEYTSPQSSPEVLKDKSVVGRSSRHSTTIPSPSASLNDDDEPVPTTPAALDQENDTPRPVNHTQARRSPRNVKKEQLQSVRTLETSPTRRETHSEENGDNQDGQDEDVGDAVLEEEQPDQEEEENVEMNGVNNSIELDKPQIDVFLDEAPIRDERQDGPSPSQLARSQSSSQMTSPPPSTPPSAVEDNIDAIPKENPPDLAIVSAANPTQVNDAEAFPTPTTAIEAESSFSDHVAAQTSKRQPDPLTPADSTNIETPGQGTISRSEESPQDVSKAKDRVDVETDDRPSLDHKDSSSSANRDQNLLLSHDQDENQDESAEISAETGDDTKLEPEIETTIQTSPTIEDMGEVEKQLHAETSLSSRSPMTDSQNEIPTANVHTPSRSSEELQIEAAPLLVTKSEPHTPEHIEEDNNIDDDQSPKSFVTPLASTTSPLQSSNHQFQKDDDQQNQPSEQQNSSDVLTQSAKVIPSSQDEEETLTDEDKVDPQRPPAPEIIPELRTLKSFEKDEQERPDLSVACENIDDCVEKKMGVLEEEDLIPRTLEQDVMPPDSFTPGQPLEVLPEPLETTEDHEEEEIEENLVTGLDVDIARDEQAAVDQILIEDESGTAIADPLEKAGGEQDRVADDDDVNEQVGAATQAAVVEQSEKHLADEDMDIDKDVHRSLQASDKQPASLNQQQTAARPLTNETLPSDKQELKESSSATGVLVVTDSNITALIESSRPDNRSSAITSNTTTHVSTPLGRSTSNKHLKRPSGSLTRLVFTGRSTAPPSEVPDTADSTNASSRNSPAPAPARMGTRAGSMSTSSTPGRMASRSTEAQRIISLAEAREQQARLHQQQHLALQRHQKRKKYDVFDYATAVQVGGSLQAALGQAHKTLSTKNFQLLRREKQAIQTVRQVEQLQKAGLWSLRQPIRATEPPRNLAHWDFLLKEMKWLSTDFREGRKWNIAQAKLFADWCRDWHETPEAERSLLCVSRTQSGLSNGSERSHNLVIIKTDEDNDHIMDDDDVLPDVKIEDVADQIYIPDIADLQDPGSIFSLGLLDTVFHMMPTTNANQIMAELPMLCAPRPPPPGAPVVEVVPDWKPNPPTLNNKHTFPSMVGSDSGPPIKKSRYQYDPEYNLFDSEESDDDALSTPQKRRRLSYQMKSVRSHIIPLEPERTECALFNPEFQPILHRLHNAHLFRPPVEMPPATFFEYRHPSQWTAADDEELKEAVKTYNHNWLLVSISLQPKSAFQSGADRRSLWECFERWVGLDPSNAEHVKGPFFRPVQQRLELAARAPSHLTAQAVAATAAPIAPVPTPPLPNSTAPTVNPQAPVRRKTSQPMRVERRRNTRCLSMFDQMRKLAKKREMQQSKQQHSTAVAIKKQQEQAAQAAQQGPRSEVYTPQQVSRMKHEKETLYKHQQQQQILRAQQAVTTAQQGRLPVAPPVPTSVPLAQQPIRTANGNVLAVPVPSSIPASHPHAAQITAAAAAQIAVRQQQIQQSQAHMMNNGIQSGIPAIPQLQNMNAMGGVNTITAAQQSQLRAQILQQQRNMTPEQYQQYQQMMERQRHQQVAQQVARAQIAHGNTMASPNLQVNQPMVVNMNQQNFASLRQEALSAAARVQNVPTNGHHSQSPEMNHAHPRPASSPRQQQQSIQSNTIINASQASQIIRQQMPLLQPDQVHKLANQANLAAQSNNSSLTFGLLLQFLSNNQAQQAAQFHLNSSNNNSNNTNNNNNNLHAPAQQQQINPNQRVLQQQLQQVRMAQTRGPSASPLLGNVTPVPVSRSGTPMQRTPSMQNTVQQSPRQTQVQMSG